MVLHGQRCLRGLTHGGASTTHCSGGSADPIVLFRVGHAGHMPRGRATVAIMARSTGTAELLARAALAFIEENGDEALTIRALGAETGLHHTAAYRHYRSKNDLLRAVLGLVLEEAISRAGELPADPRERLLVLSRRPVALAAERAACSPGRDHRLPDAGGVAR